MGTGLTLTVLGCDGSYPGPGGACSGYLLQCGVTSIWVDAGSGTLANLQRHIDLGSLDAVVVTHSHPDHFSDLDHLAVALRWYVRRRGLGVFAPRELKSMMRSSSAADVFDWQALSDCTRATVGPIELTFSRTDHPVPTFAVRADGHGRSLGYSADSGPGWSLAMLGNGLDLALCEATFLSDKEGSMQHMSARQAGATAADSGAARLVITHLAPGVDREAARAEASAAFGDDVLVASIGARYEV